MTIDPKTGQEIVLVLQGGGALGAYQGGIYQALDAAAFRPGWVAGISIGAVNAAIIAGNSPERRVDRLTEFWQQATSSVPPWLLPAKDESHALFTTLSAAWVACFGVPGFFTPRVLPPALLPVNPPEMLGHYDTRPLRQTLERLVDFDRINAKETRLSVGAVNVKTGNFAYFDNWKQRIGPEHIMASGAIPPGFPPVEIDGEYYWDGGIVSNTPLQYVLDEETNHDLLVFQVDLFSARGEMPKTMLAAAEREKDIRFSSRTRLNTDSSLKTHQVRASLRRLLERAPRHIRTLPEFQEIEAFTRENAITVVHFIKRRRNADSHAKDYEFSRSTMREHWAAGMEDVRTTLDHQDWMKRRVPKFGVAVFDLAVDQVRYTSAEGLEEVRTNKTVGRDGEQRRTLTAAR